MNPPLFSHSFTSKRAVSPNPYLDNPVNGYACPSGMALHYDDVPINGMVRTHVHKGDNPCIVHHRSDAALFTFMADFCL